MSINQIGTAFNSVRDWIFQHFQLPKRTFRLFHYISQRGVLKNVVRALVMLACYRASMTHLRLLHNDSEPASLTDTACMGVAGLVGYILLLELPLMLVGYAAERCQRSASALDSLLVAVCRLPSTSTCPVSTEWIESILSDLKGQGDIFLLTPDPIFLCADYILKRSEELPQPLHDCLTLIHRYSPEFRKALISRAGGVYIVAPDEANKSVKSARELRTGKLKVDGTPIPEQFWKCVSEASKEAFREIRKGRRKLRAPFALYRRPFLADLRAIILPNACYSQVRGHDTPGVLTDAIHIDKTKHPLEYEVFLQSILALGRGMM